MPDIELTSAELTRPIIGIENRTPQEVFDIMCDRVRHSLAATRTSEAAEPVAWRPTYAQIIDLVEACRVRRDKSGESSRMMSKWISEGLNSLYAAPHPSPVSEEVTEAAFAVLEADKQFRASMSPSVERDPVTLACDRLAAALASLRSPKP